MDIVRFNKTINIWINALQSYDLNILVTKPDNENWSLGQVFLHLINETNYYIEQIVYCLSHYDNCSEPMSENAVLIFSKNEFPDERFKNEAQFSQNVPQPADKSVLLEQLLFIKNRLNSMWYKIMDNNNLGKTRHPGLGYFNAKEWFQFAELHLRHHLKQKNRIEMSINYVPQNKS